MDEFENVIAITLSLGKPIRIQYQEYCRLSARTTILKWLMSANVSCNFFNTETDISKLCFILPFLFYGLDFNPLWNILVPFVLNHV